RECGFSNPSYFSRVVREKTGLSPKEYREKGE
ncbi:MAG: AraC family transcriptional regulator, partial [Lentisphaeria bacterium]|nr:AraC family transcriptional regulator [Lentisphaeria bacterium]